VKELVEVSNGMDFALLSEAELKDVIANVEQAMIETVKCDPSLEVKVPVSHHFSKGVYAREIRIPKGSFIVGKIHKFENLNILSKGRISILSIDGVQTVEAPFTVVSSPGVKRVAYAHEDCVWTTIHGTDEKDVDKIEEVFIAKSYDEVVGLENKTKELT
jgi:hypothetical protein